ncbi:hypothetical protein [Comamonas terrigena]|uniref:hypothetical protein n=1 Tax=Comamonas terrigena TaxID=32013 RepID=UPI0024474C96|nr:hypothetical protein [Comamonas terrigena]MDH1701247.1 hypothetical protein [Comamonas terrigena]
MQTVNRLPAAELLALAPQKPQVANDILRTAGHAELGQEYLGACNVLNNCSVALLKIGLDSDDMIDPRQSPRFIAAAARKAAVWQRIEAVKAAAQDQLFPRTKDL